MSIDPFREQQLESRMLQYIDDFDKLVSADGMQFGSSKADLVSVSHVRVVAQKLRIVQSNYQMLDFRWNAFVQSEQVEIAESDRLMDMMTRVQQLKQVVGDSIVALQGRCDAVAGFLDAEVFISSQDTVYKAFYKKARTLSLSKRLAQQLEKVKADEKVVFEQVQAHYDKSRDATKLFNKLNARAAKLDEQYYTIKTTSDKIQALEYKPLLQRAKDYLLGLASVSIILIFVNLVTTKLKSAKKARDMAKKQKKLFDKNNNNIDYPTI